MRRTKIVATIGPATSRPDALSALLDAGVDVVRLNAAHGTPDVHRSTRRSARDRGRALGRTVGVLVDLPGPKLRTGPVVGDEVQLETGSALTLTSAAVVGDEHRVSTTVPELAPLGRTPATTCSSPTARSCCASRRSSTTTSSARSCAAACCARARACTCRGAEAHVESVHRDRRGRAADGDRDQGRLRRAVVRAPARRRRSRARAAPQARAPAAARREDRDRGRARSPARHRRRRPTR